MERSAQGRAPSVTANAAQLMRNLRLANGEVAYHLQVLEREGIIHSAAKGARRMYYPAEMPLPDNGNGLHAVQERILTTLDEAPGTSIKELAALLGLTPQLAMYHARHLHMKGFVRFERRGVRFVAFRTSDEEHQAILRAQRDA